MGSRIKYLIDHMTQNLERVVHAARCDAAGGVQDSFVGASDVVDRRLYLFVGHARPDESA